MSVDRPLWLAAGAVLAIGFALLYDRFQRRATARDLAYSNVEFFVAAAKPRAWIPRALQALWIVAVASVLVALSGPHLSLPVPARDGSVFICIDTSGSMASSDVTPTRAQAAKGAAAAFIDESAPGTKIGIIAFSGTAGIVQPLSTDHRQVASSLDELPLPNGATAIGDALKLAAENLPDGGHRVVILITDGVNNAGVDPLEIARWLGAHRIPVYTVGIGTPNGGLIPGTSDEATIDEDALRALAEQSGGAYAKAVDAGQLKSALAQLGGTTILEKKNIDATLPFAFAGGLLMIVTLLGGTALGRFP